MDAVKFLKERDRMCENHSCKECPIGKITLMGDCSYDKKEAEKIVEVVEDWSKENPEEVGKKYIIEVDAVDNSSYHCCHTSIGWFSKSQLEQLEEYKESEE